jgi:hypothetical protein
VKLQTAWRRRVAFLGKAKTHALSHSENVTKAPLVSMLCAPSETCWEKVRESGLQSNDAHSLVLAPMPDEESRPCGLASHSPVAKTR